jgi:hypothetical protein
LGFSTAPAEKNSRLVLFISREIGLFSREIGLFSREIGLFSREIGFFSREIGLFSREISLFSREIDLFARENAKIAPLRWLIGTRWGIFSIEDADKAVCWMTQLGFLSTGLCQSAPFYVTCEMICQ